jgi:hypothetical protein
VKQKKERIIEEDGYDEEVEISFLQRKKENRFGSNNGTV